MYVPQLRQVPRAALNVLCVWLSEERYGTDVVPIAGVLEQCSADYSEAGCQASGSPEDMGAAGSTMPTTCADSGISDAIRPGKRKPSDDLVLPSPKKREVDSAVPDTWDESPGRASRASSETMADDPIDSSRDPIIIVSLQPDVNLCTPLIERSVRIPVAFSLLSKED